MAWQEGLSFRAEAGIAVEPRETPKELPAARLLQLKRNVMSGRDFPLAQHSYILYFV